MPAVNLLLCVVSCRLPHSSWTWTPWECHSLHEDGSVQMMTLQPPTAMPTSHPLPEMDSLASSLSKLLFLSIRYGREEVHRTAHSSWKLCSWTQVFDALKNPPYISLCSGCYSCRSRPLEETPSFRVCPQARGIRTDMPACLPSPSSCLQGLLQKQ